jgi:hypothetical protein
VSRRREAEEAGYRAVEDDLARLGNALVYLEMITDRVGNAMQFARVDSILQPAVEDLAQVARLIRDAQRGIKGRRDA